MLFEMNSEMFLSSDSFLLANNFTSSGFIVILLACLEKHSKSMEFTSEIEKRIKREYSPFKVTDL